MRLMQGKTAMSVRAKVARGAVGAAAMMIPIALAVMFHVVPTVAQAQAATPVASKQATVTPSVPAGSQAQPGQAATNPTTVVSHDNGSQTAQRKGTNHVHRLRSAGGKPLVIINGEARGLTPEKQRRLEKQLADAQQKIAEATAKINSPEFRKQVEDAQRQAMQADAFVNSPAFKQQMADTQREVAEATAKINSPEFKKQIEDAQRQAMVEIDSAKIQAQMAEAQKQVAEATAKINSPEFKKQMEEAAQAAAKIDSAEIQKQMALAQKQMAEAMAKMKAEQGKTPNQ